MGKAMKYKLGAGILALILLLMLLLPNPGLLPARTLMGLNRHEGAIKYLAWYENRYDAHLDTLFLKAELYYLTGQYQQGLILLSQWMVEFENQQFSLTREQARVLALYGTDSDIPWDFRQRAWEYIYQGGGDYSPWDQYQQVLVHAILMGSTPEIPDFSQENFDLRLLRLFVRAKEIGSILGWNSMIFMATSSAFGSSSQRRPGMRLPAEALRDLYKDIHYAQAWLEANMTEVLPPYTQLALDLKSIYRALEIAVFYELDEDVWLELLQGSPDDVLGIFAASSYGFWLGLDFWQEIFSQREASRNFANVYEFCQWRRGGLMPSPMPQHLTEHTRLDMAGQCTWSQDGTWLAVVSHDYPEILLYSLETQAQYTLSGSRFFWAPRGNQAVYLSAQGWTILEAGGESRSLSLPGDWEVAGWILPDLLFLYRPQEDFYSAVYYDLTQQKVTQQPQFELPVGAGPTGGWYRGVREYVLDTVPLYVLRQHPGQEDRYIFVQDLMFTSRHWLADSSGFKELILPPRTVVLGWVDREHLLLWQLHSRQMLYNPTTGAIIPVSSNFLVPSGTGYLACSDYPEETIIYRFEP